MKYSNAFLFFFYFLVCSTTSCMEKSIDQSTVFVNEFANLMPVSIPMPIVPPVETSPPVTSDFGNIRCTVESYSSSVNSPEMILMNPSSDVIWLGSLLNGATPMDGSYTPIIWPLSPKKMSISLSSITGSGSIVVDNPTLSSTREQKINLLRNITVNSTEAQIFKSVHAIRAREEADLAIRAQFSGFGADVGALYDWESTRQMSRHAVTFQQVYYSIDLDLTHRNPAEYFVENQLPDINLFGEYVPVYVSSIKYGRQIMFAIESTLEESEQRRIIEASFNRFSVSAGFSLNDRQAREMESLNIKGIVLGGDGVHGTGALTSIDALEQWMLTGGNYSPESPGVPLAYTLRFLHDNSIAQVNLSSEYQVRNCQEISNVFTLNDHTNQTFTRTFCESVSGHDLGGRPTVEGRVTLSHDGREIFANLDVELVENGGNSTIGRISRSSRKISLGFIPQGSRFESFSTDPIATFSYQDVTKGDEDCYGSNCSGNEINASEEFISSIRMQASTSGDDVGSGECSDVPGDAYIKIKFDPILINVSRN